MKQCYWCSLAGLSDTENQHDADEIGASDKRSGLWICDNCADGAQGIN